MLVKEISLNKTSSQQITEYICEPETSEYTIDCYPYIMREFCGDFFYLLCLGEV